MGSMDAVLCPLSPLAQAVLSVGVSAKLPTLFDEWAGSF